MLGKTISPERITGIKAGKFDDDSQVPSTVKRKSRGSPGYAMMELREANKHTCSARRS
jgi:hypothetical protein